MVIDQARPLAAYVPPEECRRSAAAGVTREAPPPEAPKLRPLDRVRAALRIRHYSRRTEEAYVARIRPYILFHDKRHPAEMNLSWPDAVVRAKRPYHLPVVLARGEVQAVLQLSRGCND